MIQLDNCIMGRVKQFFCVHSLNMNVDSYVCDCDICGKIYDVCGNDDIYSGGVVNRNKGVLNKINKFIINNLFTYHLNFCNHDFISDTQITVLNCKKCNYFIYYNKYTLNEMRIMKINNVINK